MTKGTAPFLISIFSSALKLSGPGITQVISVKARDFYYGLILPIYIQLFCLVEVLPYTSFP